MTSPILKLTGHQLRQALDWVDADYGPDEMGIEVCLAVREDGAMCVFLAESPDAGLLLLDEESCTDAGQADAPSDERATFEAWALTYHKLVNPGPLKRLNGVGCYFYGPVQASWAAWQARADLAVPAPTRALADVVAERRRQIGKEGWTQEHDDEHSKGELARAAACYARWPEAAKKPPNTAPLEWPWSDDWWKPRDPRSNYVRAAALLLAEIERIDRAAEKASRHAAAAPWLE